MQNKECVSLKFTGAKTDELTAKWNQPDYLHEFFLSVPPQKGDFIDFLGFNPSVYLDLSLDLINDFDSPVFEVISRKLVLAKHEDYHGWEITLRPYKEHLLKNNY